MPAGPYRSSIEGVDDRPIIQQGYEDAHNNKAPRAWELYPESQLCRSAYRQGYAVGWNEKVFAKR